jgi:hypothetical protein
MAIPDVKQQREELERIYNPPPPMALIYKILVFGTIGAFFGVVIVRHIHPEKVPQITFPQQQNNERVAN